MHLQLAAQQSLFISQDAFKSSGCCHKEMALLTLDCEVQMYEKRLELEIQRKVAGSVVAAEISDHLNAFSNISGRGTETVFLTISLSLSILFPPLCLFLPRFLTTSPEYYSTSPAVHQDDAIFALHKNVQHNKTQSINCPSAIRCMQLVNALFLKFLPTRV